MVLDKRNSPNEYLENIGFCDGIKNQGFYATAKVIGVRWGSKYVKERIRSIFYVIIAIKTKLAVNLNCS